MPRRSNGAVVAAAQSVVADEQSVVAEEPASAPYSDSEHGESDWSMMVEPPQSPREFERFLAKLATSCPHDVLNNIMRFADGCLAASLCKRTQYTFLLLRRDWRCQFRAAAVLPEQWVALLYDEGTGPRRFRGYCQVCNRLRRGLDPYYVAEMDVPLQRRRLTVPFWGNLELFRRYLRYVPCSICLECYTCLEVFWEASSRTGHHMARTDRLRIDRTAGREIVPNFVRRLLDRGIPSELVTPTQPVVAEESEGGESENSLAEVSRLNNLVSVPSSAAPRARVRVYIRRG